MFARCLSSLQAERVSASSQLKGPSSTKYTGDKKEFIEHIRKVIRIERVPGEETGYGLHSFSFWLDFSPVNFYFVQRPK